MLITLPSELRISSTKTFKRILGGFIMAQSIYVTLATLRTETSVPEIKDKDGKVTRKSYGSVEHTLPRSNYPTPEVFDNEEEFLAWAKERGALLHLLQNGISADIIDDRALFKASVKGAWSPEIGQNSVNNRTWTIAKKPDSNGGAKVADARYNDCLKMIGNMCINKMPTEQIKEYAIPVYGEELVNNIFTFLEGLKKD